MNKLFIGLPWVRELDIQKIRFYVEPADGQWLLIKDGAEQPTGRFHTDREAIDRGRETARARSNSRY
jgi:hypothetical protein